jgi:type I restriction enzyme S subunit
MTVETFFANFGHLADAPNGVQKLRELILQLAVQGKLVPQDASDEPASVLLKRLEAEKATLKISKTSTDSIPPEEISYELPSTWVWARFGNITQHNAGKTLDKGRNTGQLRDYITTSNLYWGYFDLNNVKQMPIEDREIERCTARAGDLLIVEGGEAGRAAVWTKDYEVCFQNHVHRARFYCDIDPFYVYRFFEKLNLSGEIGQYRKGVGISNMSGKALASIVLPLPPLVEQKRIVAKVDQLMALCNELETRQQKQQQGRVRLNNAALDALLTAREPDEFADHWQRISTNFDLLYDHPETIAKLRAAILQLAVQGKLVRQIDGGISVTETIDGARQAKAHCGKRSKSTKILPPLNESEMPFILPPHWSWIRLNDIILLKHGYAFKSTFFTAEQTPYVLTTPGNFFERGGFRDRGVKTKYYRGDIDGEFILNPSDLIIPMTEQAPGLLGSPAFIPNDGKVYLHNQRLAKVTLLSQSILPEFVACFFNCAFFRDSLAETCSGTTVRHTSPDKVLTVPFPLPPLEEQKRIVAKVDQLMDLCDELEAKLNQAQQHSEKLMEVTVRQLLVA